MTWEEIMTLGFIGLGKMGTRMVVKLRKEGHVVMAWNRSPHEFKNVETIEKLIKSLENPRVIWLMVTAGGATQNVLDELSRFLEKGDIIIDGGNSYFKDTQRRYEELRSKNIKFLGIGVSGGIVAATNGYPLMVGGDKSAYEFIKRILDSLAKPHGGHEYFGEGGAGHFVKMVHNGIEYGIMQSLGEGFGVLDKAPYKLDLLKVAKLWQRGTLVSGFMLDRAVEVLKDNPKLSHVSGIIPRGGEGDWTVEAAKEEGLDIKIIDESVEFRRKSETDPKIKNSFTAKMINALRNAFGGHETKKK